MQFPLASYLWIASLYRPVLYPGGKVAILQPASFFQSATEEFQLVYAVYPFSLCYLKMWPLKWRRKPAVRLRNIQWVFRAVSLWRRSLGMKPITCLHLMSRLRMSGAKSPFPSLTYTSCTGTTLLLPCLHHEVRRIVAATKLKMGSRCGVLLCFTDWVQDGRSSITFPSFCCCWKPYSPAASDVARKRLLLLLFVC